jgi:hypothetical protein
MIVTSVILFLNPAEINKILMKNIIRTQTPPTDESGMTFTTSRMYLNLMHPQQFSTHHF